MHYSNPPESPVIYQNVRYYVAAQANFPIQILQDDFKLKGHPLRYDDRSLIHLAQSLRGYINSLNKDAKLSVSELRKKDFTVKDTYILVATKILSHA